MSTGGGDAGAAASASPFPDTAAAEAVEYQSTLGDVPPWMSPVSIHSSSPCSFFEYIKDLVVVCYHMPV